MSLFQRLILIFSFVFILGLIIAYGRGYRLNFNEKTLTSTGILAITSSPKAAKIFINGEFKGATDSNLTLSPGKYQVEIKKEGYTSWKKEVILKGEWVVPINAVLFSLNPSLSPLTNLGINKAFPLDNTDKILIFSQKNDLESDGIYLFENPKTTINILPPLKLLVTKKKLPEVDFETAEVVFSPDYKEAIVIFTNQSTFFKSQTAYLLSLDQENQEPFDVTTSKETLISTWEKEKQERLLKILNTYPKDLVKIASDSFKIISFSPDETKFLYQPLKNLTLPLIIKPPLIATNQTPEQRNLIKGKLYLYDRKEDKNYQITEIKQEDWIKNPEFLQWYFDSKHLVFQENKKIIVIDYDNLNRQTLYSGPFQMGFFNVTSNGKLIILANLNPETNPLPDLYLVDF